MCERHGLAWDCATGNGQAAVSLAGHFDEVIATDASSKQIDSAIAHPRVSYRVAPAETSRIASASADLITVGQALHWFDSDKFFAEANRVIVPGGIIAVWCYELCVVSTAVDAVVDELYQGILDGFWSPERALVEEGYLSIAMPGSEVQSPEFDMQLNWRVDDMLGYLRTWSACKRYQSRHAQDPVGIIEATLKAAWGSSKRAVRWPLRIRVCRL
ncbi:MAG: class I SAM-dependent methyltransferase [Gammaproteobacteria bacterium]|nr:class I SAM-dependent methyltransferase [Gammaproteobacteria bacterium]